MHGSQRAICGIGTALVVALNQRRLIKKGRSLAKPIGEWRTTLEGNDVATPFLKWPGGKRWFVCSFADLLPAAFGTYVEPFLGAGSVFFHLRPRKAVLGDINSDLINAYQAIKKNWEEIKVSLRYHQRRHREDADGYYYQVREQNLRNSLTQASRLIYLNRTCFNGVYRVNQKGQFNVPRGSKDSVVFDTDDFELVSKLLKKATLFAGDFEPLVSRSKRGDFVFCDPPYTVRHNYNGFLKYNEVLFSWSDQERLANALRQAALRGVKVLCTNANHDSIHELYDHQVFDLKVVSRYSTISADIDSRRDFEELVIRANI
jgi:DNA adenine methylase